MRYNLLPFTDTNSVICKIIVGTPLLRCPRTPEDGCPYGNVGDGSPVPREAKRLPYERNGKGERYMKATGIVRRVEECVIIGQTAKKTHKHLGFRYFAPLNALVSKTVFWRFLYIAKARGISPRFCNLILSSIQIRESQRPEGPARCQRPC